MTEILTTGHDTVLNLYKKKSETPLQTIERYVSAHPEYKGVRMTYAGRLDPMAEGVLVVLTGEKNKEREAYTGLDKDYEFEFILGVETDTHDTLGKITSIQDRGMFSFAEIDKALRKYHGGFDQAYPAYSSKVVDGKQLFEHARAGRSVVLPMHPVVVKGIELVSMSSLSRAEFFAQIRADITAVKGDFRQREILKLWEKYEKEAPDIMLVYKARVSCGSGFYVRQLVSDIGRDLGVGAVTISILRTRVGNHFIEDSLR